MLEQQFYAYDTNQVLIYLEAYRCYKEKTNLLKKLGKFEFQVLNFASKYRLMTKESSSLCGKSCQPAEKLS